MTLKEKLKMNKKSQLEVGDILRLNYAQIESGYASELYMVEPQNDWYEYHLYIESGIFVIIYMSTNKQLILAQQVITTTLKDNQYFRTNNIINISEKGNKQRINEILHTKKCEKLSWGDIGSDSFDDNNSDEQNLENLKNIINEIEILNRKDYKLFL